MPYEKSFVLLARYFGFIPIIPIDFLHIKALVYSVTLKSFSTLNSSLKFLLILSFSNKENLCLFKH